MVRFKRQVDLKGERTWEILFQNLLNNHHPITYCGGFKTCVYGGGEELQR